MTHGYEWFEEFDFFDLDLDFDASYDDYEAEELIEDYEIPGLEDYLDYGF